MLKKKLPVILILDMSESMRAYEITLRKCVDKIIQAFKKTQDEYPGLDIYMASIFANDSIVSSQIEALNEFQFNICDEFHGICEMGLVLNELNRRLTRCDYMSGEEKKARPEILWITNGHISENENDQAVMNALQSNGWFVNASRKIIHLNTESECREVLSELMCQFVNDPKEGIINSDEFTIKIITIGPNPYQKDDMSSDTISLEVADPFMNEIPIDFSEIDSVEFWPKEDLDW